MNNTAGNPTNETRLAKLHSIVAVDTYHGSKFLADFLLQDVGEFDAAKELINRMMLEREG
jgi:hypothetical protein